MLCSNNRFSLPGSPSTCTLDTAVVPVPSFLLFVAVGLVSSLACEVKLESPDYRRSPPTRWLHITYALLVVAALGMSVLEIARLGAAQQGLGLLPVMPLALCLVLFLLWHERHARTRVISFVFLLYWITLVVMEAIKSARLQLLEGLNPAKDTKYPSSDWLLDNLVMLGLFVIFMFIEIAVLAQARRRAIRDSNQTLVGVRPSSIAKV
ncbi:hypothetical protein HGRIS_011479 [Hohenbuehelia grisea]|uniref:Uncharacterized protein n=1 Tax=Hohenbuehelia grisea TaxID=104357 RepID=A0ABR3JV82_9AGAR